MNFGNLLSQILDQLKISTPQFAHMIGVKPSTPYFWLKGRSVPGQKTLELIVTKLGLDKESEIKLLALHANHKRAKVVNTRENKSISDSKFAKRFREILKSSDIPISKLAQKSGVTRASIYFWQNGDLIPKVEKLSSVLKFLNIGDELTGELISLCQSESKPRPVGYKNRSVWEKDALDRFLKHTGFSKIKLHRPRELSTNYDLILSLGSGRKKIPIIFKNKTGDMNLVFVMACKARQTTASENAIVVTFKEVKDYDEGLFKSFGITLMTEEMFYLSETEMVSKLR